MARPQLLEATFFICTQVFSRMTREQGQGGFLFETSVHQSLLIAAFVKHEWVVIQFDVV